MRQIHRGESSVDRVARAAEWVAANSASCRPIEHKEQLSNKAVDRSVWVACDRTWILQILDIGHLYVELKRRVWLDAVVAVCSNDVLMTITPALPIDSPPIKIDCRPPEAVKRKCTVIELTYTLYSHSVFVKRVTKAYRSCNRAESLQC